MWCQGLTKVTSTDKTPVLSCLDLASLPKVVFPSLSSNTDLQVASSASSIRGLEPSKTELMNKCCQSRYPSWHFRGTASMLVASKPLPILKG
ncbi:MAG TPA: hypothetical protein DDW52_28735 [Planctomycetaceae bacterium]|nr:hypothetical protein [Planctomycetaceae bacterium]